MGGQNINDVIEKRQRQKENRKRPRCACGRVADYIVIGEGVAGGAECVACKRRRKGYR
jgi:hypothetical protein